MLLGQLIVMSLEFVYLDPLVLVLLVEESHLSGEMLFGQVQSLLQALALGLVLDVLVAELNHLATHSLELQLLTSTLLLYQDLNPEGFREATV